MRFLFDENAGDAAVIVSGKALSHLKVRRARVGDRIALRNLLDYNIYYYSIENFVKTGAVLAFIESELKPVLPRRDVSLAWCAVDPKTIAKTLPALNEIGVGKLTLLLSERSQRNFRANLDRLDRVVAGSCEQCGRSRKMEIVFKELSQFAEETPNAAIFDFGGAKPTSEALRSHTLVVGPEGGFANGDYATLKNPPRFGIDSPLILRSETAIALLASLSLAYA